MAFSFLILVKRGFGCRIRFRNDQGAELYQLLASMLCDSGYGQYGSDQDSLDLYASV